MILRRFTQHVNEQNWFAVGLDLAVVVLGIVIGLGVTDWNQSRKNHQEGLYYIQALNTQIGRDIKIREAEITRSTDFLSSTFQAVGILWADEGDDGDLQIFNKLHTSAFQFWGPLERPAALRQLVDGGKIDLIRSKDIQKAILDYESAYVDAIQQTQTSYAYSKDITLVIMNSIPYRGRAIASTLEELRNNQALIAALRGKAIMQRIQLDTLNDIQKADQNLQMILTSYLQKALPG